MRGSAMSRTAAVALALVTGMLALACGRKQAVRESAGPADLIVFVREGCPHCAKAEQYLSRLQEERPGLVVAVREVTGDPSALRDLRRLSEAHGIRAPGVPTFVVGNELLVGFDESWTTGREIEAMLDRARAAAAAAQAGANVVSAQAAGARGDSSAAAPAAAPSRLPATSPQTPLDASVRLPLVGTVDLKQVGLPAFTVAIGLLDGFNPCAMWVLLFLLSVLVGLKSRSRMLAIGGVFLLTSGVVYFAFMAAWLNVFLLLGMSRLIQVTLGVVALAMGALNLKDFFAFGRGPSLKIPERAKPGIYARVRKVLSARTLAPALAAVIVLAALVNTVELLCTAGLPALYTQVLTMRGLSAWQYYGYLALYNVFYMADDMMMLVIAVVTLSNRRLQQADARWLKLVAGALIFSLGAVLILKPQWLAG